MGMTHTAPDARETGHQETFLHLVAREFQWALRALCVLLLFTTAVVMATFNFWAIIPAIALLLCYTLLVVADGVEHATDTRPPEQLTTHGVVHELPEDVAALDPEARRERATHLAVEKRLTRISLEVLFAALALGGTLGVLTFGWKLLPVALLVLAGYAVLVTTPVWLAWMEKDMQEEVSRRES